ncbi:MAG: thiol protease/hemagglutinin PrtT [Bacteroides sp.]
MMCYNKALRLLLWGLVLFLTSQIATAAPIDVQRAARLASEQLQRLHPLRGSAPQVKLLRTSHGHATRGNTQADYYLFGAKQGEGWVLVAGDDAIAPILAYSPEGHFPETLQPELQSVLRQYQHLVQEVRRNPATAPVVPILSPSEAVSPLLHNLRWSQFLPYNQLLPLRTAANGTQKRAPTGCVATAVAQVMRYHAWPPRPQGKVTHAGLEIDFDNEPDYAWGDMLGVYSGNSYSEAQGKTVARLMRDVGYAAKTTYKAEESSAHPREAFEALRRHFQYAPTLRYYVTTYHDVAEWQRLLIDELKAGRPVPMDGVTITHAQHEFVCDGYDGQGLFHINWGWGEASDGYYLLHAVGTGDGGDGKGMQYNFIYGMLVGMQSPAKAPHAQEMKEFYAPKDLELSLGTFAESKAFTCTVHGLLNEAYSPVVGTLAVVLKGADGAVVYKAHAAGAPFLLKGSKGSFETRTVALDLKEVAQGTYTLHPAFYEPATDTYTVAMQDQVKRKLFTVTVGDRGIVLEEGTRAPQLTFKVTPAVLKKGEKTAFQLSITNTGTQPYLCPIAMCFAASEEAPSIADARALPFLAWMRIDPGTTTTRSFSAVVPQDAAYLHLFYNAQNNDYYSTKLPWHAGKQVSVPRDHHSQQRLTLAESNLPEKYTITRLSVTERLKRGEHFRMAYEVRVDPSSAPVNLNLLASFVKVVESAYGTSTEPVKAFDVPTQSLLPGETKRLTMDFPLDFPVGEYQLMVYGTGFALVPELVLSSLVVEAGSAQPPSAGVPVPSYPDMPAPLMSTVHAPTGEQTVGGECPIYLIDTKERLLKDGEQIPRGALIGIAPKAAEGYKLSQWEVQGATYLADESYGNGSFLFVGKLYQTTEGDVWVKVSFTKEGEGGGEAPQPQPNPNPKPEPQPNPQPNPNPKPEPQPNPQPQPNPNPKPEPQPNPQPQPNPNPKPEPQPNPQPQPNPNPKPEPQPNPQPQPNPNPKPEPQPNPQPNPQPQPNPNPKPEPQPNPQPQPNPNPKPEPQPNKPDDAPAAPKPEGKAPDTTPVEDAAWTDVIVAPNPCTTSIRISRHTGVNSAKYTLYSAMGGVFLSGAIFAPETELSVSHLPAGVYFLQLQTAEGAKLWRVVKL